VTPLLVLLGLLSIATLASRRGAVDQLVQSASTPLLVGLGVLLSPRVLGVLSPSTVAGLGPALDVFATMLALVLGVRTAALTRADVRPALIGATGVLVSVALALAVLVSATLLADIHIDSRILFGAALLVGAGLAGLPADGKDTPHQVAAWAHATEICAALVALAALAVSCGVDAPVAAGFTVALGAVGALVFLLLPSGDEVARTIALLGVVTLLTGLSRIVEVPGALAAFLMGLAIGRSTAGQTLAPLVLAAERPLRIVVTLIVASTVSIGLHDLAIGAALALGQLAIQGLGAFVVGVHRTRLSAALASSATPVALVASFAASSRTAELAPVFAPILVAVASLDVLALVVGLVQRRGEGATNLSAAP
jgi:hypothetical protein